MWLLDMKKFGNTWIKLPKRMIGSTSYNIKIVHVTVFVVLFFYHRNRLGWRIGLFNIAIGLLSMILSTSQGIMPGS